MGRAKQRGGARPGSGPKPAAGVARGTHLTVKLTPDERAAIDAAAASEDPPVGAGTWVRERALEALGIGTDE